MMDKRWKVVSDAIPDFSLGQLLLLIEKASAELQRRFVREEIGSIEASYPEAE